MASDGRGAAITQAKLVRERRAGAVTRRRARVVGATRFSRREIPPTTSTDDCFAARDDARRCSWGTWGLGNHR